MREHSTDWKRERLLDAASDEPGRGEHARRAVPGKSTLTEGLFLLRMARDVSALAANAELLVSRAARSGGEPLPDGLRSKFESSLGADLGAVRIHSGSPSAAAAGSVRARAYTLGNDIHFAAGEYAPQTSDGQHLLAHEVAHTVQQAGVARRAQFKLEVSHAGDFHEREADAAAQAMVRGAPASVSAASGMARATIQRQQRADAHDGGERASHGPDQKANAAEKRRLRKAVNEATTTLEEATKELGRVLAERKKAPKKPYPSKQVAEIKKRAEAAKKSGLPSCQKLQEIAADEGKADPAVPRFERALKAWEARARSAADAGKAAPEGTSSFGAEQGTGGWGAAPPQGAADVPDVTVNESPVPMSSGT